MCLNGVTALNFASGFLALTEDVSGFLMGFICTAPSAVDIVKYSSVGFIERLTMI